MDPPRTEELIMTVAAVGTQEVDLAIAASRRALSGPWSKMTAEGSCRLLYKLADIMEANAEELSLLDTLDNGKPIFFGCSADIPPAIDLYRYRHRYMAGGLLQTSQPHTRGTGAGREQQCALHTQQPTGTR